MRAAWQSFHSFESYWKQANYYNYSFSVLAHRCLLCKSQSFNLLMTRALSSSWTVASILELPYFHFSSRSKCQVVYRFAVHIIKSGMLFNVWIRTFSRQWSFQTLIRCQKETITLICRSLCIVRVVHVCLQSSKLVIFVVSSLALVAVPWSSNGVQSSSTTKLG